jgi:DNA-binding beta-propeller fold protein YncE
MIRSRTVPVVAALALCLAGAPAGGFTTFESGQVRPLAMSPDGARLFACNTPDNRVDIFSIGAGGALTKTGSVNVGLEPVAIAARTNDEIWVVNHLSDSISIVDVTTGQAPRITRTLLVGDEPRDIVFAGPGRNRAFITTARRGQNLPASVLPNLTTASTPRALVFVFEATNLGSEFGGTPLNVLELFTDTPRALAVSANGATVYAAGFHTGNQTTAVNEGIVCDGGAGAGPCVVSGTSYPGGLPAPNDDHNGVIGPETGLIVKFNGTNWVDPLGRNWTNGVRFNLPDRDVFAIDANANPPAQTSNFQHVGTILFNMIVNPVSGKVYVTNTEANNAVRFEGPGTRSTTVRGHLAESRVTVLDGATVTPRHLNKHINYAVFPPAGSVAPASLATPVEMAISSNGQTLYVAAFGSGKIGIFDTAQLEANTFTPSAANHISVSGGGPSGIVLDEARQRLYVLTRFDNGISVVNTASRLEVSHTSLHNPEPATVVDGRPVLYDALRTSSNGETACASCHIFGDFDSLAWDLGNPDDEVLNNPNPSRLPIGDDNFHPLKGPMTTQSLRGMANQGPMHWRGDRTGGNDPGGDPLDEVAAFKKFIGAFEGLVGRTTPLPQSDMDLFTDFALQVVYPPNPIRNLDNSLTTQQLNGRNLYFGAITDSVQNCNGCHTLNVAAGFFGTDGFSSFENETQHMKIAHLRNAYQKVGMFGFPAAPFISPGDNGHKGDQIRGFGFLHDGSIDTVFRFLSATVFNTINDTQQRNLEAFALAFDSNLAPVVGQQITLSATNAALVTTRLNLLIARAAANECDLTAKARRGGVQRGVVRLANGTFKSDASADGAFTDAQVRGFAAIPGQEVTYTCVPPGEGRRIGIDRDGDNCLDFDDPAPDNASGGCSGPTTSTTTTTTSTTSTTTTTAPPSFTLISTRRLTMKDKTSPPTPARRKYSFVASTSNDPAPNQIVPPARSGAADPTIHGATIRVYNGAGLTSDDMSAILPAVNWKLIGTPANPKGYKYRVAKNVGLPVTKVVIKANSLSIRAGGSGWGYTLNEAQQGSVGLRLTLADGSAWCTNTPAAAGSPPPDQVDLFKGLARAAAPATCPPTP